MPTEAASWQEAAELALQRALSEAGQPVTTLAVDGTSGTVLWTGCDGTPLTPAMRYDEPASASSIAAIAAHAPQDSAALGAYSGLARALDLADRHGIAAPCQIASQSDWIAGQLMDRYGNTDEHNALKIGYDPVARCWPSWLRALPLLEDALPTVYPPGRPVATIAPDAAKRIGLEPECRIIAGTTDSIAGFLAATEWIREGEAVTSLGSTLALKLVSRAPISSARYGVYSHRLGEHYLAGGASNCGASILAHYFTPEQIEALTARIDPERGTGLDYYPLPRPGERFPHLDPELQPRLEPRPEDEAIFLQGLMEGIAQVEAEGYQRLVDLGAPAVRRVITAGGGAANAAWTRIRARYLGVPVETAAEAAAAVGAARLAHTAH